MKIQKKKKKGTNLAFALFFFIAHIEALGKPRRLGPFAASAKKNIVHRSGAFLKLY